MIATLHCYSLDDKAKTQNLGVVLIEGYANFGIAAPVHLGILPLMAVL